MSASAYRVYARFAGDKSVEHVAAFKFGDDAYQYATLISGTRFADARFTVSVLGWDERVWWQFRGGKQTDFNKTTKVQP